jgi:hypothetical protein
LKTVTAILILLMFSSVASAQNPDPSKWMCRNLADSGGFLYQGESLFGSQACRPIPQTAPAASAAPVAPATPKQDSETTTPVSSTPSPATTATQTTSAPAQVRAPAPAVPAASSSTPQQSTSSCVVLKRMGPADEVTSHPYSFGIFHPLRFLDPKETIPIC